MRKLLLAFVFVSSAFAETVQEASQREAIQLYPSLLSAGSPLNKRFLKAVETARAENDPVMRSPDWVLTIAKKIGNKSASEKLESAAKPQQTPWVPSSSTLGGSAGSTLGTNPAPATYAIGGTVSQKTGDGLLINLSMRGSMHKIPKGSLDLGGWR